MVSSCLIFFVIMIIKLSPLSSNNNDVKLLFGIEEPYVNNFSTWRVEITVSCKESPNVFLPLRLKDVNHDDKADIGRDLKMHVPSYMLLMQRILKSKLLDLFH